MTMRKIDTTSDERSFQSRVADWMDKCFGPEISADRVERNHRFIEEALELVQACGCTQSEAHQLVDYVYGRDQGDINQEVGGVMVTLAALCLANNFDMYNAAETELARVWTKIDKIRAKQAAKPKHSPLPETAPAAVKLETTAEEREYFFEHCVLLIGQGKQTGPALERDFDRLLSAIASAKAEEREACAKTAETEAGRALAALDSLSDTTATAYADGWKHGAEAAAAAIRKRGEHEEKKDGRTEI